MAGVHGEVLGHGKEVHGYENNMNSAIVQLAQFLVPKSCVLTMSLRP